MTETYGIARTLKPVHKFIDGYSKCQDKRKRHYKLKYERPNWKPEYEGTCPECKRLDELDEIERRGKLIQSTLSHCSESS